jgi:hypothetical protein
MIMPIWFLDAEGNCLGEHSSAYPAPPEILNRLRVDAMPPIVRVVDVPPLTHEFFVIPEGSDIPVARPLLELNVSNTTMPAGETHPVVLEGVPEGSKVTIVGPYQGEFVADGSPLALTFLEEGEHEIRVNTPGFRPHKIVVNSVPEHEEHPEAEVPEDALTVMVGIPGDVHAEQALEDVETHFRMRADKVRDSLAMLNEAKDHLAGKKSQITKLAKAEGITPDELANRIVTQAQVFWDIQEEKTKIKRKLKDHIDKKDHKKEVLKTLKQNGIQSDRMRPFMPTLI